MSPAALAARAASVPPIRYPDELPVVAVKADIAAAIAAHQVVVIAGETGSGKTTQLPKICLELGRGIAGRIGHTQPRRIAARAVAERVADELGVDLGGVVGYQVRFADHTSRNTLIKVMTDGILLAELSRDRQLRRYDTLIIDEAHERSLGIDFLLGYLKRLLPERPDLKLVITSATIDPQRFADHFATNGVSAPVIEVSGRTFPVEVRYRPLSRPGPDGTLVDVDQVSGICEAVTELWTEGPGASGRDSGGHDILVFLSGEREIRDAADAVAGLKLPDTQVLPLYGRLSAAEQHRVFSPHRGRRVVLATNVAETSLTVPGIRYVVDTGTARISRYSQRTKVQRLPIEPISQASAQQRSGRCGRLADGVAIRLYSPEDFEARPAFTEPEILRTNLASVILQMADLRLGRISDFPFIDPPDTRQVRDGQRLLAELGAIENADTPNHPRLTSLGRRLARLPLDPRLARMLLAAEAEGAVREVLIIVAALSIQDVRERPSDKQTQADQSHARFRDERSDHNRSDFASILNLWDYLKGRQKELSGSAFRRMCTAEYLHYLRIREWQDVRTQLSAVAKELGLTPNQHPADLDAVHRAVLTGLLSHVGWYDPTKRDYLGARAARFSIQPGSALTRRPPEWVMAAELVETSRLWARVVAPIDPAWAESSGAHLVKRSYSEPHWSSRRGGAMAIERVTLYGVPLAADRPVPYGRIDPVEARMLFIRHALVEGDWRTRHVFFHANRRLLEELEDLEHRARRRDILVDDDTLVDFYDRRLPAQIVSAAHFDSWWKRTRRAHPDLLTFTEDDLVSDAGQDVSSQDYPAEWVHHDIALALSYQFEPGSDADGVTVHIPLDLLNQISPAGFEWSVPGLRTELAIALLKSLPKATRRAFVPTPDHALAALAQVDPAADSLTEELARALFERTGVRVPASEWDWDRVPDHLRMTFRIEDAQGKRLAEGKDLDALRAQLQPALQEAMGQAAGSLRQTGLTAWTIGDLPTRVEQPSGPRTVTAYPGLVDHGTVVSVEAFATPEQADAASALGVRRLLLLTTTVPWSRVLAGLSNQDKLALADNPHGSVPVLLEDCVAAVIDAVVAEQPAGVRTEADFERCRAAVNAALSTQVAGVLEQVRAILGTARTVRLALAATKAPATAALRADLEAQLERLIHPGFVAETGLDQLPALPRYLRAMSVRLERAGRDLSRDAELTAVVHRLEAQRHALLAQVPAGEPVSPAVRELRWMIEELRVSLFAQVLGTPQPVSEKRIHRAIETIRAS